MSKVISTANEVMRAFNRMNEKGVVLFPGLDGVISLGRIIDDGRFIRCELEHIAFADRQGSSRCRQLQFVKQGDQTRSAKTIPTAYAGI